ncbi:MAG: CBS domain-containing protein [Bdellovibrionales bacterium]|nr:CBS domain-containing protein [Bdellovibrionales bacterium]
MKNMKQMPQIQKVMTAMPHTIGADIELKTAQSMMREHRIRHLPVQKGGKLVGVLTDRDVKLAAGFDDALNLKVEEIMTDEPYTVTPETPLDRVVLEMAEKKYGCAVILQGNGKVVGIFTAVDGMRVLGETLESFYKPGPDNTPRK